MAGHLNSSFFVQVAVRDAAKLSVKFQISIPKAGQEFAFIPKGERMLLVPIPKPEDLAGLARGATPENDRHRTDRC